MEGRQVLGGLDGERRLPGEPPAAEPVAVVDVVVGDVEAAVAVEREVGVADPDRAGLGCRRRRGGAQDPGDEREGGGRDQAGQAARGSASGGGWAV